MDKTVTMTEIVIPVSRLTEIESHNCYCGTTATQAIALIINGGLYECSFYCDEHVPFYKISPPTGNAPHE